MSRLADVLLIGCERGFRFQSRICSHSVSIRLPLVSRTTTGDLPASYHNSSSNRLYAPPTQSQNLFYECPAQHSCVYVLGTRYAVLSFLTTFTTPHTHCHLSMLTPICLFSLSTSLPPLDITGPRDHGIPATTRCFELSTCDHGPWQRTCSLLHFFLHRITTKYQETHTHTQSFSLPLSRPPASRSRLDCHLGLEPSKTKIKRRSSFLVLPSFPTHTYTHASSITHPS